MENVGDNTNTESKIEEKQEVPQQVQQGYNGQVIIDIKGGQFEKITVTPEKSMTTGDLIQVLEFSKNHVLSQKW